VIARRTAYRWMKLLLPTLWMPKLFGCLNSLDASYMSSFIIMYLLQFIFLLLLVLTCCNKLLPSFIPSLTACFCTLLCFSFAFNKGATSPPFPCLKWSPSFTDQYIESESKSKSCRFRVSSLSSSPGLARIQIKSNAPWAQK